MYWKISSFKKIKYKVLLHLVYNCFVLQEIFEIYVGKNVFWFPHITRKKFSKEKFIKFRKINLLLSYFMSNSTVTEKNTDFNLKTNFWQNLTCFKKYITHRLWNNFQCCNKKEIKFYLQIRRKTFVNECAGLHLNSFIYDNVYDTV